MIKVLHERSGTRDVEVVRSSMRGNRIRSFCQTALLAPSSLFVMAGTFQAFAQGTKINTPCKSTATDTLKNRSLAIAARLSFGCSLRS
jgi:hypothetical protein